MSSGAAAAAALHALHGCAIERSDLGASCRNKLAFDLTPRACASDASLASAEPAVRELAALTLGAARATGRPELWREATVRASSAGELHLRLLVRLPCASTSLDPSDAAGGRWAAELDQLVGVVRSALGTRLVAISVQSDEQRLSRPAKGAPELSLRAPAGASSACLLERSPLSGVRHQLSLDSMAMVHSALGTSLSAAVAEHVARAVTALPAAELVVVGRDALRFAFGLAHLCCSCARRSAEHARGSDCARAAAGAPAARRFVAVHVLTHCTSVAADFARTERRHRSLAVAGRAARACAPGRAGGGGWRSPGAPAAEPSACEEEFEVVPCARPRVQLVSRRCADDARTPDTHTRGEPRNVGVGVGARAGRAVGARGAHATDAAREGARDDYARALARIAACARAAGRCVVVVATAGRQGLGGDTCATLASARAVRAVAHVSCCERSAASDLGALVGAGMRRFVCAASRRYDALPGTGFVSTFAWLERASLPSLLVCCGPPATGKSSVARVLGALIGAPGASRAAQLLALGAAGRTRKPSPALSLVARACRAAPRAASAPARAGALITDRRVDGRAPRASAAAACAPAPRAPRTCASNVSPPAALLLERDALFVEERARAAPGGSRVPLRVAKARTHALLDGAVSARALAAGRCTLIVDSCLLTRAARRHVWAARAPDVLGRRWHRAVCVSFGPGGDGLALSDPSRHGALLARWAAARGREHSTFPAGEERAGALLRACLAAWEAPHAARRACGGVAASELHDGGDGAFDAVLVADPAALRRVRAAAEPLNSPRGHARGAAAHADAHPMGDGASPWGASAAARRGARSPRADGVDLRERGAEPDDEQLDAEALARVTARVWRALYWA
ncbi:hypothetical protein KFE25_007559 [Diacronema lutheri]|uniref:Uncharacterized protein n=1 Tax=Diacronema lutheri TaxID=2081491 RepID=A0A8J6CFE9_DIALT|nr:hypothetical protein KFE25_007559 [Diacronema lutheri]